MTVTGPSAADVPEDRGIGTWELADAHTLVLNPGGEQARQYRIVEAAEDRLVLKPE